MEQSILQIFTDHIHKVVTVIHHPYQNHIPPYYNGYVFFEKKNRKPCDLPIKIMRQFSPIFNQSIITLQYLVIY